MEKSTFNLNDYLLTKVGYLEILFIIISMLIIWYFGS